ncbi:hypothetical protein ZIOFF_061068 [Zingiber officinale]|uniref:Uncharacterized protein n=1 Tax=Zingiber officinale TaxID=94328 RepID=A0A8J5FCI6_ZINOF|nr:hypothetical protein ZIOFF_061068 [Zingiber officinale]
MFEVSKILRDAQPKAYEPKIVSLGPYHYHKPHLRAMNQQHKWSLLNKLLDQDRSKDLKYYLKVIKDNETRARNAYPTQSMIGICENQFVTMMLLDCVFVIEILWLWKKSPEGIKNLVFMSEQRSQIIVARDMLLLENQLPFFLIETLFDSAFTGHPGVRGKLKSWLGEFFSGFLDSKISQVPNGSHIHHILHLFYLGVVPSNINSCICAVSHATVDSAATERTDRHQSITRLGWIPSATRLEETRIKFRRNKSPTDAQLLGITFEKGFLKGVLTIPQFEVDDDTNILFRNLIALEQCDIRNIADVGAPFTAYVFFMSCIIHTAADVEILQRNDIIISGIGSNRQVARLFNSLCKEVVVDSDKCYLSQVVKEVNAHSNSIWKSWWAELIYKYFRTPWSFISFAAAFLFFTMAVVQLTFTIKNYKLQIINYKLQVNKTHQ